MTRTPRLGVGIFLLAFMMIAVPGAQEDRAIAPLAERYVKLVLAAGQHDPDLVDAYYGPEEWRAGTERSLPALETEADALLAAVRAIAPPTKGVDFELRVLRREYLEHQVAAVRARLATLRGAKLRFDEESRQLYDAVAPRHQENDFEVPLADLAKRLPGDGPLIERFERFRSGFVVPPERLDRVFTAAIDACRERTLTHIALPPEERFTVEYVTGKSWSGYNWYQGNYRSLIQVNTDLPIYIDRALDLACHEGYPGHHVYNSLLERALVRERGWPEFSVYPLFSPQSLIAEGTANYGIEVAFPRDERLRFERDVLFPLAGLDASRAGDYYQVLELTEQLDYAGNEAARRYLDGEIDAAAAVSWLERYAMMPRPRAEQRVKFFDQYRSYVINYNLGRDLVRRYVERTAGAAPTPAARWKAFAALLSSPRLPSGLQ